MRTNEQIIFSESVILMNEGKLAGSGKFINYNMGDHVEKQEIPEAIHTYSKWQELGYQVKEGEKAIASFSIWKAFVPDDADEATKVKMYMRKASFFSFSQVKEIEPLSFDSHEFEKLIPNKMRFKTCGAVNNKCFYWVTQEPFNRDDLLSFQKAFKNFDTNIKYIYVTVRDLSTYDFNEDYSNAVFALVGRSKLYTKNYINAINKAGLSDYIA